ARPKSNRRSVRGMGAVCRARRLERTATWGEVSSPSATEGGCLRNMQTSTREVDDVIIVDLSGRLTLGEGVTLQNAIRDLALKGNRKILLNLADSNYIDGSGVGQ